MNSISPAFKREDLKSSQSGHNVEKRCTKITSQWHFDANTSASNMQLNWPQVTCGPPPEAPEGGYRTFQNKAEGSTAYATEVTAMSMWLSWSNRLNTPVPAAHNSFLKTLLRPHMFRNWPTSASGEGLTLFSLFPMYKINSQWFLFPRSWSPHPSLPSCHITHCPDLPQIPSESNLEEVDSQWAEVEGFKRLRCKGSKDEFNHTMFFESDRSKSELLLECLENGTYAHVDEWPVCLQGVLHIEHDKLHCH